MTTLHVPTLLRTKRDGGSLTGAEWRALVEGYTRGDVPDYQMAALAMAVFFRGATPEETAALTLAMRDSGRVVPRGTFLAGRTVDKHSTGGVGDKVSLPLAPIAAACGLAVPMITGRGLGHTGGTADKLESIPGFRVRLSFDELRAVVGSVGCALAAQSEDLAPADLRLYALRDVTATVESIPLITASILSKKLAEGLDALVMDVKVGRGAFMPTLESARALADSLCTVGAAAGTEVRALLTRMDVPLGRTIGNALEVREAVALLEGEVRGPLLDCTVALACEMLVAVGAGAEEAERLVLDAIGSGRARARFDALVAAQGGDPKALRDACAGLPHADVTVLEATEDGFVQDLDALRLGVEAMRLGAGRNRKEDAIDPAVGLELAVDVGDAVVRGAPLVRVHHRGALDPARRAGIEAGIQVAATAPPSLPHVVIERRRATPV